MKKTVAYISVLLFIFLSVNLYSQNTPKQEIDSTLFNLYNGKLNFNKDSLGRYQGKIYFKSDIEKSNENKNVKFKELHFSGEFVDDKKEKTWEYKLNRYNIDIQGVQRAWDVKLKHQVNGEEQRIILNFDSGVPSGKWETRSKQIKNGRYQREILLAQLNFEKGVLVGDFFANKGFDDVGEVKINGKVNKEGFFDGLLTLEYYLDDILISEKRTYQDGFLIYIEKKDSKKDEVISSKKYTEVEEKLEELYNSKEKINFKISQKGFGVLFDNGYQETSEKHQFQTDGNKVLKSLFNLFDDVVFLSDSTKKTEYKLTRRFQYVYPNTDDSLISVLKSEIEKTENELQGYLNKPRFVLRRNTSDSLAHAYTFIEEASNKVEIIKEVIRKIEDGFFDFLYRPNYYDKGVVGLNRVDTLKYTFEGNERLTAFDVGFLVTESENLIVNLRQYLKKLNAKSNDFITFSKTKMQLYDQQDKIDSLDAHIVQSINVLDSLYKAEEEKFENVEANEIPLYFKIYKSTYERLIKDLEKKYLDVDQYEEKVNIGIEYCCLLDVLNNNKQTFKDIEQIPNHWNDSLFTKYQYNPFDNREFESKIVGNIQRAGTRLLRHHVEEILRAGNCERIETKLEKIIILEKRIVDLAERYEEDDVKNINRALRRENVPARIERVLDL